MGSNPWVGKIPWRRKLCFSILAWEILWTEEPGGLQSMGRGTANGRAQLTERAHTHISHTHTHTHTCRWLRKGRSKQVQGQLWLRAEWPKHLCHLDRRTLPLWEVTQEPHRLLLQPQEFRADLRILPNLLIVRLEDKERGEVATRPGTDFGGTQWVSEGLLSL